MFIQYFKQVVVNALLISFEMDLRTVCHFCIHTFFLNVVSRRKAAFAMAFIDAEL
jgi:hypothetical protein